MSNQSVGEPTLWRLLEALRWLMFDSQPPGMPGKALRIRSHRNSKASLIRTGDNRWRFVDEDGNEIEAPAAQIIECAASHTFVPSTVEIRPMLAPILFQEAVRRTSQSVTELSDASKRLATGDLETNPLAFVMITAHLDRALQSGLAGTVLAIASAEAQANDWGESIGQWSAAGYRNELVEKLARLARNSDRKLERGSVYLQQLQESVSLRNRIVHSVPAPVSYTLTGKSALAPGRSASLGARRACLAVRESLIAVGRAIGVPVESELRYLAYCPSVDPTDDRTWSLAEVMTGVRADPVFPAVNARVAKGSEEGSPA